MADHIDKHISHAGVGGERIDLRRIGTIAGMNLYVDVGGQTDPELAYKTATAIMFRAFVGHKHKEKKS